MGAKMAGWKESAGRIGNRTALLDVTFGRFHPILEEGRGFGLPVRRGARSMVPIGRRAFPAGAAKSGRIGAPTNILAGSPVAAMR
jgi:hypothetical protein